LTRTYFVAIAATFILLALIALAGYVASKIGPSSFRLRVGLARIISFNIEMESRGLYARNVTDGSEQRPEPDSDGLYSFVLWNYLALFLP
jgi:hypothetical protein